MYTLNVIEYPSGRFGYVGSVPVELAFVAPDGGPADPEEAQKRCQFGGSFGNVKTRSFATAEEAQAFAQAHGYTVQMPSAKASETPAFETFAKVYHQALADAVAQYPNEYAWPVENAPAVAAKMLEAIKRGSYNKDSRAIKATCKTLGIKHTYKAIDEYLGLKRA